MNVDTQIETVQAQLVAKKGFIQLQHVATQSLQAVL